MTHLRSFLFPRLQNDISPQALRPLLIAGLIEPIVDGDGGINYNTYHDWPDGLFCAVNAYAPPMRTGDTLDIYWGKDNKIFTRALQDDEDDSNKPVFFFLPVTNIHPGWVDEVYYVLTRAGHTTPEEPSVPLRVLVKLDLPGGVDKEPHKPGHSELHIVQLPQDVIENGVDAVWTANGVDMTIARYPNMAVHDVIQVKWGQVLLSPHSVSADEVAGTTPIVVTALPNDIVAAGDSDALLVRYEIHDQVWNYSADWSQSTYVKVQSEVRQLVAPIIQESFNGIIDLDKLGDSDVNVRVNVKPGEFDLDDTVTLKWTGTPKTGNPLVNVQSKIVNSIPGVLNFQIPNTEVRAIAGGSADASYVLYKKNGGPPFPSKRAFTEVVAQMPAPVLKEAMGDTVMSGIGVATVEIQYPGMADGDIVNMALLGIKANGNPHLYEAQHIVSPDDAKDQRVILYVPGEHLRILQRCKLNLFYQVSGNKPQHHGVSESKRLEIEVKP